MEKRNGANVENHKMILITSRAAVNFDLIYDAHNPFDTHTHTPSPDAHSHPCSSFVMNLSLARRHAIHLKIHKFVKRNLHTHALTHTAASKTAAACH